MVRRCLMGMRDAWSACVCVRVRVPVRRYRYRHRYVHVTCAAVGAPHNRKEGHRIEVAPVERTKDGRQLKPWKVQEAR